jgi:hypothetical protein
MEQRKLLRNSRIILLFIGYYVERRKILSCVRSIACIKKSVNIGKYGYRNMEKA